MSAQTKTIFMTLPNHLTLGPCKCVSGHNQCEFDINSTNYVKIFVTVLMRLQFIIEYISSVSAYFLSHTKMDVLCEKSFVSEFIFLVS